MSQIEHRARLNRRYSGLSQNIARMFGVEHTGFASTEPQPEAAAVAPDETAAAECAASQPVAEVGNEVSPFVNAVVDDLSASDVDAEVTRLLQMSDEEYEITMQQLQLRDRSLYDLVAAKLTAMNQ